MSELSVGRRDGQIRQSCVCLTTGESQEGRKRVLKAQDRGEWWREQKGNDELFAFGIVPDATGRPPQTERFICSWFPLLILFVLWAAGNPLDWCPLPLTAVVWWDYHSLLNLSPGFVALPSLSTSAGHEWSSFGVAISSKLLLFL